MTGRLIAIVGPSGVGKDSVMQSLAASNSQIKLARRVITRPADPESEEFDSVSEVEFKAMRDAGQFSIWWQAHGLSYAISTEVDELLSEGHDVLANLSRSVLTEAQSRYHKFVVIALSADREVLKARLIARGRESSPEIERRVNRSDVALPSNLDVIILDNSGPLERTRIEALSALSLGVQ